MDGNVPLGTASLDAFGNASLTTSGLALGSHSIQAMYGGDSNYSPSTSATLTQTVEKATSVSVASNNNPSTAGQSVTLSATVTSPQGGTPTGTITFMDGQTVLGTAAVNGMGSATFTVTTLTAGSHSITAIYGGNSTFAASTSSVLTQTVQLAQTFTSLASSLNPSAPAKRSHLQAPSWVTAGPPLAW